MKIIRRSLFSTDRWRTTEIAIIAFWYLSLFPGRIGYDYVQLSKIIRSGSSTDWWSPLYFWFFKLLTLCASTLALVSLVQIVILYLALDYFLKLFKFKDKILRISRVLLFSSPIFGAFAVNVSHDVTFTSGLILLCALNYKNFVRAEKPKFFIYIFAYLLLLTSFTGYPIVVGSLVLHLFFRNFKIFIVSGISILIVMTPVVSTVETISKDESRYFTLVADIKCITQHKDSQLAPNQWSFLKTLSETGNWKNEEDCRKSVPDATDWQILGDYENLKSAVSILVKYPILTMAAHVQRTAGVFPPPFPGPDNQIDYSSPDSLGLGTNTSLQDGPQALHISIDDPVYSNSKLNFLKPLEYFAQLPIFIVNQSSWLWGWGGFWLIFIFLLVILKTEKGIFLAILSVFPLIINHLIVFVFTAQALPRYMMSSILLGFFSMVTIALTVLGAIRKKLKYELE